MNTSKNFFVIDNFNTVPVELLKYCGDNYILYDASIDESIPKKLEENAIRYTKIPRIGYNISTYFRFFVEHYDNLPEVMVLTKGHMIGRHCSEEFFDRVCNNTWFTYLYEDKSVVQKAGVNFLITENVYAEINNSWYVKSKEHPHQYFDNFNRLLKFIYKNPIEPEYCVFAPGGCYIVSKDQVLKNSKEFYNNLNKIMTYELNPNFPSEAHQIERMLPIIFSSNYEVNSWMNNEKDFEERLSHEKTITQMNAEAEKSLKQRILKKISNRNFD